MNETLKNGLKPSKEEERRINIRESIRMIEEGLESLIELDDGENDIVEGLEKGITICYDCGAPTFTIKIVPENIRDILGV